MATGGPDEQVSDRVLTVPNALSALRLVGVPVFLWAILSERDGLAIVLLMASGLTDYLDGKIARTYGLVSRVGQLLDPIADRLYIVSTLLGLAWREIIPWWLVAVLFAREAFMAVVVLIAKRHGWVGLPVHFAGKAATFNLLYAFPQPPERADGGDDERGRDHRRHLVVQILRDRPGVADERTSEGGGPRALLRDSDGSQWLCGTDGSTSRVYYMSVPNDVMTCRDAHCAIAGIDEDLVEQEG